MTIAQRISKAIDASIRSVAMLALALITGLGIASYVNADVAAYVAARLASVVVFDTTSNLFTLRGSSVDGADNQVMCISSSSGVCADGTRGAYIYMTGHEAGGDNLISASDDFEVRTGPGITALGIDQSQLATFAGDIKLSKTSASIIGAPTAIEFRNSTNANGNLTIPDTGGLRVLRGALTVEDTTNGTFTSARTTNLGWTVVSVANQACNTTCTSACVFGHNLTAGVPGAMLACTDATADECLCAGAS